MVVLGGKADKSLVLQRNQKATELKDVVIGARFVAEAADFTVVFGCIRPPIQWFLMAPSPEPVAYR
jgi:hypothetical protein